MRVVQPRRLPLRLAVDQAVRALRVELDHPVANHLQPHAPELRRLSARGAVVNRRKSQQPTRLRPVLRPFRRRPQPTRAIIIPKTNCCRHGEPPAVRPGRTNFSRFGNPLREFRLSGDWYNCPDDWLGPGKEKPADNASRCGCRRMITASSTSCETSASSARDQSLLPRRIRDFPQRPIKDVR